MLRGTLDELEFSQPAEGGAAFLLKYHSSSNEILLFFEILVEVMEKNDSLMCGKCVLFAVDFVLIVYFCVVLRSLKREKTM